MRLLRSAPCWHRAARPAIFVGMFRKLTTLQAAVTFSLKVTERVQASSAVTQATKLLLIAVRPESVMNAKSASDEVWRTLIKHLL